MSSTESTQKIILALIAAAGVLLLGPYLGISIFGRGGNESRTTTRDADNQEAYRSTTQSAPGPEDLELELPVKNSAEPHKPSGNRSNEETSDLEDLLKSR